jgi:tetratricopeptide (TPR) repeat protein
MSRFGNLEFESEPQSQIPTRPIPLAEETRCFTEARAAYARTEFESALRWYARTLEYAPLNVDAWTGQCWSLLELGQFREAKVWADKALEKFANHPTLLAIKAMALGRMGQLDVAMAFSDASMDQPGDSPLVWLARGDVLLAKNERQVDHCFERALQLAPGDWFIRWIAARIRAYWKQFAVALKLIQQAAQLDAGQCGLWLLSGQCQAALGLHDAALASFQQALSLYPQSKEAELELRQLQNLSPWERLSRRLFGTRGF